VRVGVLGGTFDPIHRGHTYLAREISRVFGLEKVIFMVSKYPPHKGFEEISAPFDRYAMVVLALNREESFYASALELGRDGPSYTFDTLERLNSSYPDDQFCFIAGSDSLHELSLWYAYDKLIRRHCLVFVQRPGAEVDLDGLEISPNLRDTIHFVRDNVTPEIKVGRSYLLSVNAPPISSSDIRKIIRSGQRPSTRILSSPVYRYIRKCQLYEEK
jgi:nicotinate-nucleotide adenylyltransferase